jgi:uncharacterized protein (TIGR03437 family)
VAPNSIATAFGANFPANPTVTITGNSGPSLSASVVFSSVSQIHFIVPAGLEAGLAIAQIGAQSAPFAVAPLAPSLFTLNNQGLAAAYTTTGTTNTPTATFANGVYTPVPIDVSSGSTYLILFGTGFRGAPLRFASVNETLLEVQYAGPQPSFPALDQVNLLLPASLAGAGCSNINVSTNTVYVCIQ